MKYIRMGTSSNFGNMLSMAFASLFIPFLPLLPAQILPNNLLYDLSEIGIPFDAVDGEDLRLPHVWDMRQVLRFTLVMEPLSSIFDLATFGILMLGFAVTPEEFRTAWFVESMATQILVIFLIRTTGPVWRAAAPHRAGGDIPWCSGDGPCASLGTAGAAAGLPPAARCLAGGSRRIGRALPRAGGRAEAAGAKGEPPARSGGQAVPWRSGGRA
jgi:magnesium-transporting ATPase (P-type)